MEDVCNRSSASSFFTVRRSLERLPDAEKVLDLFYLLCQKHSGCLQATHQRCLFVVLVVLIQSQSSVFVLWLLYADGISGCLLRLGTQPTIPAASR